MLVTNKDGADKGRASDMGSSVSRASRASRTLDLAAVRPPGTATIAAQGSRAPDHTANLSVLVPGCIEVDFYRCIFILHYFKSYGLIYIYIYYLFSTTILEVFFKIYNICISWRCFQIWQKKLVIASHLIWDRFLPRWASSRPSAPGRTPAPAPRTLCRGCRSQSWKVRSARDRTIRTIRTIRILSK